MGTIADEAVTTGDELKATEDEVEMTWDELKATRDEVEMIGNEVETTGDELKATRNEVETTGDECTHLIESLFQFINVAFRLCQAAPASTQNKQ